LAAGPREGEGDAGLVLTGRDAAAIEDEAGGFQGEGDIAVEAILAQCVNGDGDCDAGAGGDAGGDDAQNEVRDGIADAEAIGILRTTMALGIGELDVIESLGGGGKGEAGIGAMGKKAGAFVLTVVIEGNLVVL